MEVSADKLPFILMTDKFSQIRPGNTHDLEQFADLLEIAIMNLQETGHHHELGNGFLYAKLQTKLTESMLAKYHRWIFETKTQESVHALKTWVFQESEFQTIATETVHGMAGTIGSACSKLPQPSPKGNSETTFFGAMIDHCHIKNTSCQMCVGEHKIGACQNFNEKDIPGRWDTAKRFRLCFRCLGDGHIGKSCKNSQPCGKNGCQKLHHVLLHNNRHAEAKSNRCLLNTRDHNKACLNKLDTLSTERPAAGNYRPTEVERCLASTEGNYRPKEVEWCPAGSEGNYRPTEVERRTAGTEGNYRPTEEERRTADTEGNHRPMELPAHTLDADIADTNGQSAVPFPSTELGCRRYKMPQTYTMEGNNMTGCNRTLRTFV